MPIAAALKFTQNAVSGGAGQAFLGIPSSAVTVQNSNDAGVVNWAFALLAVPNGSTFIVGIQQSGPTPTFTFTPDVPGSFVFQLTVTDVLNNQAIDTRSFIAQDTRGYIYPSHLDTDQTFNYGSPPNTTGWASGLNKTMKDVHDHAFYLDTSYGASTGQAMVWSGTGWVPGSGGGGGPSYLPPSPPPDGSANILAVDNSGNVSWQPVGGYEIESFSISGAGVAAIVEVGSTQAVINWIAAFNFTPLSITVTCTTQPTQHPAPSGTTASGTFTGPFTSATNNTTIALTITAIDPNGAPHSANASMTYAVKIVWGSVTSPIASQALWNNINGQNNSLNTGLTTTLNFASSAGQQQTFATLASLGTPTLKDSGGDSYPPISLGTQTITENGTNQSMSFWTVGAPGITFTWFMT